MPNNKHSVKIGGMHCASCAQTIEKKLKSLKGVKKVNVNFATESANIEYDPKIIHDIDIEKAVEKTGYKEIIKKAGYEPIEESGIDREKEAREKEIKHLKNLFLLGLILSIPIFIFSFPDLFKLNLGNLPVNWIL